MSTKQQPGRRGREVSSLHRVTQVVLGVGTLLALAAAFGPVWVARVGVVIAVLAALFAVRFAWAELKQARADHAREQVAQLRAHREQLSAERRQSSEVVAALSAHNEQADQRIVTLQSTIGSLRGELSTLRGDHAALTAGLAERDQRIAQLGRDLATREAELQALRETEDAAEVLPMPRHAAVADWDALPSAEDLWSDGNHPTVVDLQQLAFPEAPSTEAKKQA
ncbi:hypothetical protein [Enemella evansiae]|uniref:hypothetical protein n=1 Tax=Enemella evansiae TaxID=2016499 RepID=UPI00105E463E|nr:hypothetical protein [Enemella evansiae]